VGELEPGELDLLGLVEGQRQVLQEPVVERPVAVELQGADRVGDPLEGVALAVGPVVGGVDAPLVAGTEVVAGPDAVHDRIPQLHVFVVHVDPRPQHAGAVGVLPGTHPAEQVEVVGDAAISVGAVHPGPAEPAALGGDGVAVLIVHVGQSALDQVFRPVVQLSEVVRGVQQPERTKAEPGDVVDDRVDELGLLGVRVGVVEPQVAHPGEVLGDAEIDGDRLGVTDVQVAVRLRGEAGLHPTAERPGLVVGADDVPDEVARLGLGHGGQASTLRTRPRPAPRASERVPGDPDDRLGDHD